MKKYQKGSHEYILWDKKSKQVRTLKKIKIPQEKKLTVEAEKINTVYADEFLFHFNENEFVIDFLKTISAGTYKVVSRIILSPKIAKKLLTQSQYKEQKSRR